MGVRKALKGREGWYPAAAGKCRGFIEKIESAGFLTESKKDPLGAIIVPHAGWRFSGDLAGWNFALLRKTIGDTTAPLFLLGVDHYGMAGGSVALSTMTGWESPLGEVAVATEINEWFLREAGNLFAFNDQAHHREHSLEVQLPFIAHFFPGVPILPLTLPADESIAVGAGKHIAKAIREFGGHLVASTDLTHYGPAFQFTPKGIGEAAWRWTLEESEKKLLSLLTELRAEELFPEVEKNHNACGVGPLTAFTTAARELGATQGAVVGHTSSIDKGNRDYSHFVNYGALIF